jgi:hypothetical protein
MRTLLFLRFFLAMALALGGQQSIAQSSTPGATVTNRGGSPDMAKPAFSSYEKQVRNLVGEQWNRLVHDAHAKSEDLSNQQVRVHFVLDPSGKVVTVKLTQGGDTRLAEISKQAVQAY